MPVLGSSTLLVLAACSPSNEANAGEPAPPFGEDATQYCAPLFEHLFEVCQPSYGTLAAYLAADARKTCRGLPVAAERNCLLVMEGCTEDTWNECGGASRSFVCDTDEDCMSGLLCDPDYQECLECLEDMDCETGSGCDQGLCIPEAYLLQ
jgi:hypothetical protein